MQIFNNIPGYIILDVSLFIFLLIGGVIGYYRGAARAFIALIAFYIPYLIYLHFSDEIASYVDLVIGLTGTLETSSLGFIGTFSGLIGGIAIFLSFFLASRFLLKVLINHEPELKEKLWGAFIGVGGNQIMAMISLMLVFMAMPAATADITSTSLWWKVTKPAARAVYPLYRDLIEVRTTSLRAAIAEDGLIKGIMSGEIDLDRLIEQGGTDTISLADNLSGEIITTLETIDLDTLQALIQPLKEDGLTAAEIDRRIQEEDQRRQQLLKTMPEQ
ncbi:MAG: hypothetical protein ACON4P_02770 [Candidatus Puniceispirillales bacterium]